MTRDELIEAMAQAEFNATDERGNPVYSTGGSDTLDRMTTTERSHWKAGTAAALPVAAEAVLARIEAVTALADDYDYADKAEAEIAAIRAEWVQQP